MLALDVAFLKVIACFNTNVVIEKMYSNGRLTLRLSDAQAPKNFGAVPMEYISIGNI